MKITKINRISHYKQENKGILKENQKELCCKEIRSKVEERFNTQIESRIYKEFIRLKSGRIKKLVKQNNEIEILEFIESNYGEEEINKKLEEKFGINTKKNKKFEKYIKKEVSLIDLKENIKILKSIKVLYFLIKELYSGKYSKDWNLDIDKLDLEEILNNNELTIKGYKLKKNENNEYPYLYKNKNKNKSSSAYQLLKDLIVENLGKTMDEIRNSNEYKKAKENFLNYKNRKIELLVKSIENNKVNIKYDKNDLEDNDSKKEKEIIKFFEKIVKEKDSPILEEKLKSFDLKSFFDEKFVEEIKDLLDELCKSTNEKIKEFREKIFSRVREKIKEDKNRDILKNIYFLELKKYIENNLSYKKENFKNKGNNKNAKELYLRFIKKVLCIDDENNINIEKLKSKIDNNFKNLLMQHILDYGKILYYKENDEYIKLLEKNNVLKLETKDLEYIKTKETLVRKMATLVSFASNSFYNLFKDIKGDILSGKFIMENSKLILKYKVNKNEYKSEFKGKFLNYFFNSEKISDKEDFLKALKDSIYNIRNGVNHFDKMENLGKYNNRIDLKNSNTVKNYFNFKKKEIHQNLKDRFISNNLEYYYEEDEIKKYFEIYKFELLKEKISFAPNFKRILKKGKDFSNFNEKNNNFNRQNYNYFREYLSKDINKEELKEFIKTRNFLLKELYYNNFYKEFLNNKEKFKEAVEKVKENKKNRSKEGNAAGKSYDVIENYDCSKSISEYISVIHKLEMERIEKSERQTKSKNKSKYLKDFIEEVFLEGFIEYLNDKDKKEKFKFLSKEVSINKNRKKYKIGNFGIEGLDKLKEDDNEILNLYFFFNMIDDKRLSEFRNEMLKYKQFLGKRQNIKFEFLGIEIKKIEAVIEFVIITREKLGVSKEAIKNQDTKNINVLFNKFYNDENEYDKTLKKFIEEAILNDKKNIPFYSTNEKIPIVHSNLEKMRKYGTENFLSKVQKNFKYTKNEKDTKNEYNIEELQNKKIEIHNKWIEMKRKYEKKDKNKYNDEYVFYVFNEKNIRIYNYLEHKEKLQNVYLLHEITSDLIARNAAFINKWERDFKFLVIAIKKYLKDSNDIKKVDEFLNPSRGYFAVSKYYKTILEDIEDLHDNVIEKIFLNNFYKKIDDRDRKQDFRFELRNYISHFNHINTENIKESFVNQLNSLILLFSYDKKVQNHITKSMKTLLEKYNMEIEFEISDDTKNTFEYKIKSIKSKKGKMLGEENKFILLENEFVKNVKELLEYQD